MKNSFRLLTIAILTATASLALAAKAPSADEVRACKVKQAQAERTLGKADFTVAITGARNQRGHVLVSIFGDLCGGFPNEEARELAVFAKKLTVEEAAKFVVELPPGNYAIAVLHDENDDGHMNGLIPTEGFGFSNNKMGFMGPPSFAKAKVELPASGTTTTIKLKYM